MQAYLTFQMCDNLPQRKYDHCGFNYCSLGAKDLILTYKYSQNLVSNSKVFEVYKGCITNMWHVAFYTLIVL